MELFQNVKYFEEWKRKKILKSLWKGAKIAQNREEKPKNAIANEMCLNSIDENLQFFVSHQICKFMYLSRDTEFFKSYWKRKLFEWREWKFEICNFFQLSRSKCIRVFQTFKIIMRIFCQLPFFMLINDILNLQKYFNENHHFGVFNSFEACVWNWVLFF